MGFSTHYRNSLPGMGCVFQSSSQLTVKAKRNRKWERPTVGPFPLIFNRKFYPRHRCEQSVPERRRLGH